MHCWCRDTDRDSSAFDATDFLFGTISHVILLFPLWLRWTPPGLLGVWLNKSCCCRDRAASYQSFMVERTWPETQSDIEVSTPRMRKPTTCKSRLTAVVAGLSLGEREAQEIIERNTEEFFFLLLHGIITSHTDPKDRIWTPSDL